MENLFVKYNSSLELKKLGYNEPCFGYYVDGELRGVNLGIEELGGVKPYYQRFGFHTLTNSDIDNPNKIVVTSPTYEQAIDWLLKKINEGKSFGNERGYRYDGTYFSLTWGGMTMKVTTSKEDVVIKLIKILKGEDE